jgi:hypothetical protein
MAIMVKGEAWFAFNVSSFGAHQTFPALIFATLSHHRQFRFCKSLQALKHSDDFSRLFRRSERARCGGRASLRGGAGREGHVCAVNAPTACFSLLLYPAPAAPTPLHRQRFVELDELSHEAWVGLDDGAQLRGYEKKGGRLMCSSGGDACWMRESIASGDSPSCGGMGMMATTTMMVVVMVVLVI